MRITTIIATRTPRPSLDHIHYVYDEGKGKKWALAQGISAAETEFVYLTDDDVEAPQATEEELLAAIGDADMLIMPLRMRGRDSLVERLQVAEYAAIQQLTIETARRGRAVMCSGANLLVRRDSWLECRNELHPEIPSGDDMFLLEAFKRHGMSIRVTDDVRMDAWVKAAPTLHELLRQRMRWAGKAPRYTDSDILCCGALVVGANLLQILCPLILLVKFPIEYYIIKKRDASVSFLCALMLEIVYPLYILVSLIGGLLHPHRW